MLWTVATLRDQLQQRDDEAAEWRAAHERLATREMASRLAGGDAPGTNKLSPQTPAPHLSAQEAEEQEAMAGYSTCL